MNETWIRRTIQGILAFSIALVVGVLAFGVIDGVLVPGGSDRASIAGSTIGAGQAERSGFGEESEFGLLVSGEEGRLLTSIDPDTGEVVAEVELPGTARSVVPTPGGVSVWITFEDRDAIEVYATDTLEHEATLVPERAEGRTPVDLTFSQTGETLFVTWRDSPGISVYRHEMRELSFRDEFTAEGTRGSVSRNRRASRLFRSTDDGNLAIFFAQNGQRIGTVDSLELTPRSQLRFNADHTVLWGVNEYGTVVAVDEAESTGERSDIRVSPEHAPVVLPGSNIPVFANEDAGSLVGIHPWSAGDGEISEYFRVPIVGDSRVSGTQILRMDTSPGGSVMVLTDAGELVRVDMQNREISDVRPVGIEGVEHAVSYSIATDGNFACF